MTAHATQNSTIDPGFGTSRVGSHPSKGSHRKFEHAKIPYVITISGNLGDDAHYYQERDVKKGLRDAQGISFCRELVRTRPMLHRALSGSVRRWSARR